MAKRNKEVEAEILQWIFSCLGEPVPKGDFEDILRDGVVLCNLMNKLAPGSVKKIQSKGTNFQLMENIQRFQAAAKKYGLPEEEIFQTADLFERRNIAQVAISLYSLGRITQKHPEWNGPQLGPKMAEKNERTFTEDQLRSSEGVMNLQMGYNKGASQSGHGGFEKLDISVKNIVNLEKREGFHFFKIVGVKVNFSIGGLSLYMGNLFDGIKALEESTNRYLNENWQILADSLNPILSRTIENIMFDILRKVFDNIPADFFISDIE